jgi:hypothetical protein
MGFRSTPVKVNICARRGGQRHVLVGFGVCWWGQNPDLGVPTPRPPVEERRIEREVSSRLCASRQRKRRSSNSSTYFGYL